MRWSSRANCRFASGSSAHFASSGRVTLDQLLEFIAQFLRARRRDVILRARSKRRSQRRKIGNVRAVVFFARERLAHGDRTLRFS